MFHDMIRCLHDGKLLCLHAGGRSVEKIWITNQVTSFTVSVDGKKKPKIQYRLPLVGYCCRAAWILSAGFPNPRNSRITAIEAIVRDPSKQNKMPVPTGRSMTPFATRTNYCRAFLSDYIWLHSQQSPATSDL